MPLAPPLTMSLAPPRPRAATGAPPGRPHAEVLLARLDEERARPVQPAQLLGGAVHEDLYGGAGQRAEALLFGPAPDDHQGALEKARGRDRLLVAFVGNEGPYGEQEVPTPLRPGPEKIHVHRRVARRWGARSMAAGWW